MHVRWSLLVVVGAVLMLTGCAAPLNLIVTITTDLIDANPGDGICEATVGAGDCSLRAAVMEANAHPGNDTITLTADTYPLTLDGSGEDLATTGDLDILEAVTINGNGALIDGASLLAGDRIFDIDPGADQTVDITSLTTSGGTHTTGAAYLQQSGSLLLRQTTATSHTGGSVIDIAASAEFFLANSTVVDNPATTGIHSNGTTQLLYSDIEAPGAAVHAAANTVEYIGIIAAGTPACATTGGTLTTYGYNIDNDATCLSAPTTGDQPATDPQLGTLQDNGGPTPSRLPAPTSPAIDTSTECFPHDQRNVTRPVGPTCDTGPVEVDELQLTVNTVTDAGDTNPGDGICQGTALPPGDCPLRAAISETNATPQTHSDHITIQPALGTLPLTLLGANNNTNTTGDLDITDNLRINGNDNTITAAPLDPDGPGGSTWGDRVFHILGTANLTLTHTIITGGTVSDAGGGLMAELGTTLRIEDSTITGNIASWDGGGIRSFSDLTLMNSTVSYNEARNLMNGPGGGGGIDARGIGDRGTLTIASSIISHNMTLAGGGAIEVVDTNASIHNSTISDNGPGWGTIYVLLSSLEITNSTLADNKPSEGATILVEGLGSSVTIAGSVIDPTDWASCAYLGSNSPLISPFTSLGYNLDSDDTCNLDQPSDQPSSAAQLESLAGNGGPTFTSRPHSSSPLVDAIPAGILGCGTTLRQDQRAMVRPDGGACDIGAVEGSGPGSFSPLALTVDSALDTVDANPGDGICLDASGNCTLRAAIDETNQHPAGGTITIGLGISPVLSISGQDENDNATGDLDIHGPALIDGQGAAIDANAIDGLLEVVAGTVVIEQSVLKGGISGGPLIDAAVTSHGNLQIRRSTITDMDGFSVFADYGSLLLEVTLVTDNTGWAAVGGGNSSRVILRNSTVTGNTLTGSVVSVGNPESSMIIESSTIAENAAWVALAVNDWTTGLTIRNSLISEPGPDCEVSTTGGSVTSLGYNLDDDGTCEFTDPTDLPNTDPLLGPLADNGGPTFTLLPQPGSPLVDVIPSGVNGCGTVLLIDQRGTTRPTDSGGGPLCDIGAVEGIAP